MLPSASLRRTLFAALAPLTLVACTGSDSEPASGTGAAASSGPGSSSGVGGGGGAVGPGSGGEAGSGAGGAGGAPPALSVLFVGNSYTYVNDLPGGLHDLAATGGVPPAIDVASVVEGGASFAVHWGGRDAQPAIATGEHSHVVLQGQSVEPLFAPTSFHDYGVLLAEAVTAAGAKPVFYETWARKAGDAIYADPTSGGSPDAMQDGLRAAYQALATETGASLAPVGEAWRTAWTEHPQIELYQADGSHPSPAGTYLAACVFYVILTGQPIPADSAVPADVAPSDAATLRDVATEAAER